MKTLHLRARVAFLLTTCALAVAACSRSSDNAPRARAAIDGDRVVVTGARPQFPVGAVPMTEGFFEEARWDESIQTLQCKGWAPVDLRTGSARFVLRDPFDRLLLVGTPIFTVQQRADVAAAYQKPGLLHAGFTASIRLSNLPDHPGWTDALELYCLDGSGALYRLARVHTPDHQGWDRRADRFEVALTFRTPGLTVPEKSQGSLDLCEPGAGTGTVRLAGWAPFDGRAPQSVLFVQLAPSLAAASIVVCAWQPRPDVRAAVDPAREELERSGFEVHLRVPGGCEALREPGALRLWAIDRTNKAVELGLPALRGKR